MSKIRKALAVEVLSSSSSSSDDEELQKMIQDLRESKTRREVKKKQPRVEPKSTAARVPYSKLKDAAAGTGGKGKEAFKLLTFNSKTGMGSISNYLPLQVVLMTPSTFFKLVSKEGMAPNTKLKDVLKGLEDEVPVAPGFLTVGAGRKVINHEGRHRMLAIQQLFGDILVPLELRFFKIKSPLGSATLVAQHNDTAVRSAFFNPVPALPANSALTLNVRQVISETSPKIRRSPLKKRARKEAAAAFDDEEEDNDY